MKKSIQFLLLALTLVVTSVCAYTFQADAQDVVIYSLAPLVSTNYMRSRYVAFLEQLADMGNSVSNPIITQTALRMHANLSANATQVNFNIKKGTDTDDPGERRLAQDNIFFLTHIGLAIQKYWVSGASLIDGGNYPLYTYPDPNYFTGAAAGNEASEADALNTVFDGMLTFNSAGVDRLKEILTSYFKYVPDSQYLKLVAPQTADEHAQYGPSLGERGLVEIHGNQIIMGNLENKATLVLGAGSKAIINGSATVGNRVVLDLYGFEYSGSFDMGKGRIC